jgi:hypothetical protein
MAIQFSDKTLSRKIWLDRACAALLDYRDPGHIVSSDERASLAGYLDSNISPADAAELYQAARAA